MHGRGKREYPEKTRRRARSSKIITTCENSGVNPPGTGLGLLWWEASALATAPPLPLRLACSPPTRAIWIQSPVGSLGIFACGNRVGRCRWLTGFLGDLPFPPPFHSGAVPYSIHSASSALNTSILLNNTSDGGVTMRRQLESRGFERAVLRRLSCEHDMKETCTAPGILFPAEAGNILQHRSENCRHPDEVMMPFRGELGEKRETVDCRVSLGRNRQILSCPSTFTEVISPLSPRTQSRAPQQNCVTDLQNAGTPFAKGAAVVWWSDDSSPTKAKPGFDSRGSRSRIFALGIVPDDDAGRRVLSGSSVSPALSFRRCSILTSLHSHWLLRPRYSFQAKCLERVHNFHFQLV
ncbi:hypothetical protein PR048_019013 [Dryococelus australis]|uniref:Uncharacterized protein n=1 Tax=Dryococelus australis TaxID=614101 RepID=A0ABQ9H2D4_9NEOP|nr:hypothetical protein PR048_019013 [Dryococelus australis]